MRKQAITTNYNFEQLAEAFQIQLTEVSTIYKILNRQIDLGKFKSVDQLRRQCFNPPDVINEQLEAINEVIDGFGIESSTIEGYFKSHYWQDAVCLYVNQGESYALTVLYDIVNEKWELTSWGDFIESIENQLINEGEIERPNYE